MLPQKLYRQAVSGWVWILSNKTMDVTLNSLADEARGKGIYAHQLADMIVLKLQEIMVPWRPSEETEPDA